MSTFKSLKTFWDNVSANWTPLDLDSQPYLIPIHEDRLLYRESCVLREGSPVLDTDSTISSLDLNTGGVGANSGGGSLRRSAGAGGDLAAHREAFLEMLNVRNAVYGTFPPAPQTQFQARSDALSITPDMAQCSHGGRFDSLSLAMTSSSAQKQQNSAGYFTPSCNLPPLRPSRHSRSRSDRHQRATILPCGSINTATPTDPTIISTASSANSTLSRGLDHFPVFADAVRAPASVHSSIPAARHDPHSDLSDYTSTSNSSLSTNTRVHSYRPLLTRSVPPRSRSSTWSSYSSGNASMSEDEHLPYRRRQMCAFGCGRWWWDVDVQEWNACLGVCLVGWIVVLVAYAELVWVWVLLHQ